MSVWCVSVSVSVCVSVRAGVCMCVCVREREREREGECGVADISIGYTDLPNAVLFLDRLCTSTIFLMIIIIGCSCKFPSLPHLSFCLYRLFLYRLFLYRLFQHIN